MERQLQERLIGATMLMIVAVLVVPELLSGPKPVASTTSSEQPSRDLPSRGKPPTAIIAPEAPRGPGPKAVNPPTAQSSPAVAVPPVALAGSAPVNAPSVTLPPKAWRPQAASSPSEVAAPAAAPLVTGRAPIQPPSDKRSIEKVEWSVQVGSYAKSAAAQRIAKDLQNHGFAAVVLPVDLRGKRLYRVRVGPSTDRKTADETLRRVRRLMPSSRLVGNP